MENLAHGRCLVEVCCGAPLRPIPPQSTLPTSSKTLLRNSLLSLPQHQFSPSVGSILNTCTCAINIHPHCTSLGIAALCPSPVPLTNSVMIPGMLRWDTSAFPPYIRQGASWLTFMSSWTFSTAEKLTKNILQSLLEHLRRNSVSEENYIHRKLSGKEWNSLTCKVAFPLSIAHAKATDRNH